MAFADARQGVGLIYRGSLNFVHFCAVTCALELELILAILATVENGFSAIIVESSFFFALGCFRLLRRLRRFRLLRLFRR
jgi:hypothetical protein